MSDKYEEFLEMIEDEDSTKDNEKDNSKKSKKKSKKKKKEEELNIETNDDLYNSRFKILKKYGVTLSTIGILTVFAIAAYRTMIWMGQKKDVVHHKKDVKEFQLGDGQDDSWKKSIEQKVNNLNTETNKTLYTFSTKVDNDLNKTMTLLQTTVEGINESNTKFQKKLTYKFDTLSNKIATLETTVANNQQKINEVASRKFTGNGGNIPIPKFKNPVLINTTSNSSSKKGIVSSDSNSNSKKALTLKKTAPKKIATDIIVEDTQIATSTLSDNTNGGANNKKGSSKPKSLIGNKTGFMNALLVTGVSAPTFSEGAANPKPIILNIMGEQYLANGFKANLDGCFAMATASGNIITSRAEMLITKITCNYKKNGKMYEISQNVKGWVIGSDGKYGVKGLLVDSSGKILTKSMVMGILQGFSNAIVQTTSAYTAQQASSNTGTGNSPNYTNIATNGLIQGAGQGFANGFSVISGYYKKLLDAYFPYVDVKAGKKVTILLNGGESVTEKQVDIIDIHKDEYNDGSDEESDITIQDEGY